MSEPASLTSEPKTMPAFVRAGAQICPEQTACIFGSHHITYKRLCELMDSAVAAFRSLGIAKGDRVATLSTPRPEFLASFLAAIDIGAIWLGLNPLYCESELADILDNARPRLILTIDNFEGTPVRPRVETALSQIKLRAPIVQFPAGHHATDIALHMESAVSSNKIGENSRTQPSDPAILVYTSGSTGVPKGAVLSHASLALGACMQTSHFGIERPVVICNFPINHVAAVADVCCTTLVKFGTIIFQERFDPALVLRTIESERVTIWGGVPTMFQLLTREPSFAKTDFSSVKLIFWAGSRMDRATIKILAGLGSPLQTGYGLTESGAHVTFTDSGCALDVLEQSVGKPDISCQLRIVDEQRTLHAPGEVGEIQIKAPFLMLGYHKKDDGLDLSMFTHDDFLRTGDLASWDENGNVRIEGRISEIIKSGGYRIHPSEIENALMKHPDVILASVVGVPHPVYQEAIVAAVQLTPSSSLTPEDLMVFARGQLARYKVPKSITFVAALPRLPVGKIDKAAVRRQFE